MNDESEHSGWQTYPPWIVFDPDTKTEWVTPKTLKYFVAKVRDNGLFVIASKTLLFPAQKRIPEPKPSGSSTT